MILLSMVPSCVLCMTVVAQSNRCLVLLWLSVGPMENFFKLLDDDIQVKVVAVVEVL